jgi:hypothetical protein
MPEQIETVAARPLIESRAAERCPHDLGEIVAGDEGLKWRPMPNEDLTSGRRRPRVADIRRQRRGDVWQERQCQRVTRFRLPNRDHALSPMHVLEAQLTDIRWAHAIARGEQQHGEIPSADRAGPIGRRQYTRDLVVTKHIAPGGNDER